MSAAPVSRSSALPEITPPSRRSPERSEPEQAFALPPEPVERPRPRVEDDRNSRDSAELREPLRSDEGVRKEANAETRSSARADEAGKDRKSAGAIDRPDKAKTEPATDETSTKDATAADGKKAETAAGDKPAGGKASEEQKAAPAALDGLPVVGKNTLEEQAAPVVVPQPAPVPTVAAEFLALAALTLQGGEQAKPDGAATPESKPEGQAVAATSEAGAHGEPAATSVVLPVPAALLKVDGQAGAGGEAAVAGVKAGVPAQPPGRRGQDQRRSAIRRGAAAR
ncbi:hypothetical protein QO058_11000 [Bosea vestrisii]|uniref:hypothetical protein n=1 Tax=Bosea vestrisii TaxID=151416 RepID=UPI0024DF4009|nr:hypothetical protein [Bosea vestrisii]WID98718.1 hypothetical protein QO058_11000 [Bosea vestrisii]